jgi:hypothetical protein
MPDTAPFHLTSSAYNRSVSPYRTVTIPSLVYMAVHNIRRQTVSTPKQVSLTNDVEQAKQNDQIHVYRLYRRRFAGLLGFVSPSYFPEV